MANQNYVKRRSTPNKAPELFVHIIIEYEVGLNLYLYKTLKSTHFRKGTPNVQHNLVDNYRHITQPIRSHRQESAY